MFFPFFFWRLEVLDHLPFWVHFHLLRSSSEKVETGRLGPSGGLVKRSFSVTLSRAALKLTCGTGEF